MKVLILGGSGATGKQVVFQLLKRKIQTRIVIRDGASLPDEIRGNNLVEIIRGNIYEFDEKKNKGLIDDCDAVICCLGHNITLKGIFGKPRLLVYQSLKNICEAITQKSEGITERSNGRP